MKFLIRFAPTLSLVVLLLASGCGTLVYGTNQTVTFSSDPLGATAFVDGVNVGVTPTSATMARNDLHTIRIEKPGYIPYETTTVLVPNASSSGNAAVPLPIPFDFLVGMVGGAVADNYTGGAFDIRPTDISANLLAAADHPVTSNGTSASAPRFVANPDGSLSPIEPSQ